MKKIVLLFGVLIAVNLANAQINDPTDVAKDKATNKVNQKTDEALEAGIDAIEDGINSVFKKKDKKEKKQKETKPQTKSSSSSSSSGNNTDFSEYEGSAFVPGKNVLFFEDFSVAKLGTGNGNWHIYEYDEYPDIERPNIRTISASDGNWLKMPRKGLAFPNSFKNLPEQFTIEFDLYADPETMSEMEGGFRANFVALDDRKEYNMYWASESSIELDVHPHGSTKVIYVSAQSEYNSNISAKELLFENTFKSAWNPGEINRVSIYRNGKHVILYLNGNEMYNLPNGLPKKAQYNLIFSTNMWGDGMFVSNIRIAGDVPNATQEIKSEGKFVTNSIYFDVNSSHIKPESWATLKQSADAVKSTTGTILITGHTDSDGADEANLTLSKNRAESVKNALVKEFGIDASRLQTDGKGESQPIESNNTASGKAKNRRVEFLRL